MLLLRCSTDNSRVYQNVASSTKTLSMTSFLSFHVPQSTFSMANSRSLSMFCIVQEKAKGSQRAKSLGLQKKDTIPDTLAGRALLLLPHSEMSLRRAASHVGVEASPLSGFQAPVEGKRVDFLSPE